MSAEPLIVERATREWQDLDARHYLHPFTDFKSLAAEGSRVIARAEGVYLHDTEGNRILDGMAGLWCVNVGYGRRELADAAFRQMQELPYYNSFFKSAHPNPSRHGCLPMGTLLDLAFCVVPNDDPGYDHISQCSRCYRAMRAMQELPEA